MWNGVDSLDPEKLLQCPYDKNHQIRACRFPYQLIKCRKNHPDVAKWLLVHSMLTTRFHELKSVIVSLAVMTKAVLSRMLSTKQWTWDKRLWQSIWQCPPSDEDWDKDLCDQTSTPFVWGRANYCSNNSPVSNIVMVLKSNLAPSIWVPKSLLYVLPWKKQGKYIVSDYLIKYQTLKFLLLPANSGFSIFILI